MVKNYRKKPVVIEAVQFNGNSNKQEIEAFVGKKLKTKLESETAYVAHQGAPIFSLIIPTLEGDMKAMQNDWIIKGVHGEFYPWTPDIFDKTYSGNLENSLTEKKDDLIQKLQGLSAWTSQSTKEEEFNAIIRDSIKNIEEAVISAESGLQSYLENKENN